ncbi:MAG TPA: M3 family oligoendopeptidase, partial [Candidatus Polarisedimenticolia bacterium]|nr:M3 family oligoendopeptidase [Candidatus Polarisedimenticolia bacterium]
MRPAAARVLSLFVLTAAAAAFLPAAAAERAEVADKLKWNTADIFPSDDAWQKAKDEAARQIPGLARFQGTLGNSADAMYTAASAITAVDQAVRRLTVYASMRNDEDTRDQARTGMLAAARQLGVQLDAATSYVRPELLAIGQEKVKAFVAQDARLKPYGHFLDDIVRFAPHTRTASEEEIIAKAGDLESAGFEIYSLFGDAEFPFPEITLASGEKLRLDAAAYTERRASPLRADRIATFQAFFGAIAKYTGTVGAALNATVRGHVFEKEVRHFDSCVEAAMFQPNVPPTIYTQLVKDVRANLPVLHRYLDLRRRFMGLDTLQYEDLYAPITKSVELRYTPEQAQAMVTASTKPLGPVYAAALKRSFDERWIDWMPTTGKRSGAYSTGVYGVHPYQLMNYTGLYEEVSTLAHESGHSMHSYLSSTTQPYITAGYPIFVAEVASTLNESLLTDYMLKQTKDPDARLFILVSRLETLRTTLFRQTMFAEFELAIHQMAEKGEPLTGERLTDLYRT